MRAQEIRLSIPRARPIIAYLGSIRDPVLARVGGALDFDAVFGDVATKVEQVIQAQGSFRATSHSGVFVCH